MNAKTIVTSVLLLFVAVSIVAIGFKGDKKPDAVSSIAGNDVEPYTGVVAYYFHKTKRCATCQKIEAYSKQVVTGSLAPMIEEGSLKWETVNIDLPENQRFVDEYQLFANALVLARFVEGKQTEFLNLDQIWDLVGDRNVFMAYVQGSVVNFASKS